MFSRKNDANTSATPKQDAERKVPSVLAQGLSFEGHMRSDGDIHIHGTVKGDIKAREVMVGESGRVHGEIIAHSVRIIGSVDGQIQGRAVTLAKSARVNGDITHSQLTIEPGAFLEGHCRRLQQKQSADGGQQPAQRPAVETREPGKVAVLKPNKDEVAAQSS